MFSINQLLSIDKVYDSWSLPRIVRHVMYWSFWVLLYTSVNSAKTDGINFDMFGDWLGMELLLLLAKAPLAYFVTYYLLPKYIPQKAYLKTFIFMLIAAFVAVHIILIVNYFYEMPCQPKQFFMMNEGKFAISTVGIYRYIDLVYTCLPFIVVKMTQSQIKQHQINSQLLTEKVNAELQNLKNQLQPHFLFNTLNNIYSMILNKENKAGDAVLKLSEILSYMLYDCKNELVDLSMELKMLQNYVELEKMRYGEKLDLSYTVDGDAKGILVAPLLLMPFVENAFKHGVSNTEKKSWVSVRVQISNQQLSFFVENSFEENMAVSEDVLETTSGQLKSGIGLENVRKRLQLIYPDKHELVIKKEDFFSTKLKLFL